jgi:outer membrane PBP1 activator LpoA protein
MQTTRHNRNWNIFELFDLLYMRNIEKRSLKYISEKVNRTYASTQQMNWVWKQTKHKPTNRYPIIRLIKILIKNDKNISHNDIAKAIGITRQKVNQLYSKYIKHRDNDDHIWNF